MKTLGWITLLACAWGTSSWAQKTEQPVGSFFNVRTFGAFGDGTTLDTAAIEQAITAANAAGGGTVIFPPGIYLSGTLELLSNVTLDLQPGAVLEGARARWTTATSRTMTSAGDTGSTVRAKDSVSG